MTGPLPLAGRRAVVLGLGRFGGGRGAALWLLGQGADVTVTDRQPASAFGADLDELSSRGARLVLGGHDGLAVGAGDLLVVNPAIPPDAPMVRRARGAGCEVTSEMALLLERWPGPVLGVTGSNGKSTTVRLAEALLRAAGADVVAGGNLGGSLLGRLATATASTCAVLELSSFMLEVLAPRRLGPDVAVILNVTPNHLDRHGTLEAYAQAKAGVFVAARHAVLNADDPVVVARGRTWGGPVSWFGGRTGRSGRPAPAITVGDGAVGDGGDPPLRDGAGAPLDVGPLDALPGPALRLDLAAALLAAGALIGDEAAVRASAPQALAGFRRPPHRLEEVARRRGVLWIDDSVATTPESTAASLAALGAAAGGAAAEHRPESRPSGRDTRREPLQQARARPVVLLAGGRDKGLRLEPLVAAAGEFVHVALTVGERAAPLARALNTAGVPAEEVHTLESAVRRAAALARPGQVVLLSPGHSSHDQFRSFVERADAFRAAVAALDDEGEAEREPEIPHAADRRPGPRPLC